MTERTHRMMAKELAGQFYDDNRSERFRKENPDQRNFVAQMWPHFVDLARKALTSVLAEKGTPEHLKKSVYEAILEQNERSSSPHALLVPQATLELVEREDRALIDELKQLPSSRY